MYCDFCKKDIIQKNFVVNGFFKTRQQSRKFDCTTTPNEGIQCRGQRRVV